jgi:hypothetical protein
MFSMMDRRRPVSDTATMAQRLFSKQAKRRRPTYNINSFLVIVLAFGVNIGGTLMGAGAVLIPGGNDTLMLKSLPGLSPHAIPAFVALLFGIGVTLLFMRILTGKTLKVLCTNDICQTEN